MPRPLRMYSHGFTLRHIPPTTAEAAALRRHWTPQRTRGDGRRSSPRSGVRGCGSHDRAGGVDTGEGGRSGGAQGEGPVASQLGDDAISPCSSRPWRQLVPMRETLRRRGEFGSSGGSGGSRDGPCSSQGVSEGVLRLELAAEAASASQQLWRRRRAISRRMRRRSWRGCARSNLQGVPRAIS